MPQSSLVDFDALRQRRIEWKRLIEGRDDYPQIEHMNPTYAGWVVHQWIKKRFSYIDVLYDCWTYWNEEGEQVWGKYDAWDGNHIYEFKTVTGRRFNSLGLPREKDKNQMRDYMEATDTRTGFLIYISRGDFSVKEIKFHLPKMENKYGS